MARLIGVDSRSLARYENCEQMPSQVIQDIVHQTLGIEPIPMGKAERFMDSAGFSICGKGVSAGEMKGRLGRSLAMARIKAGLSMDECERLIDIPHGTYWRYEMVEDLNGLQSITIARIWLLYRVFGDIRHMRWNELSLIERLLVCIGLRGWSDERFIEESGISRYMFYEVKSGRREAGADYIETAAWAMDISVDVLNGLEPPIKKPRQWVLSKMERGNYDH